MDYVGRIGNLITSLNNFYNEINPATLSGAIDIIVVEQEDGDLASSPFHVRFGKLSVLLPQEKKVEIQVNGEKVPYLMKVGEAGEAFFVFETDHEVPEEFQTSPILQALAENRSDEEPPFLDISEKKDDEKDKQQEKNDTFDDDDDNEERKIHIPAELQSPKMIIEEQMDKVVTKIDPYQPQQQNEQKSETKNTIYPMDDGSTLLEREASPDEAITTTTIAKESFIIRPLDGNIHSKWMDVTHTLVEEDPHDQLVPSSSEESCHNNIDKATEAIHGPGENESIVLDISGYKTQQNKDASSDDDSDAPSTTASSTTAASTTPASSVADTTESVEHKNNTSWSWGKSHAEEKEEDVKKVTKGEPVPIDPVYKKELNDDTNQTVQLRSGRTYRIEMSLCGFAAFGYDEDENDMLFKDKQVSYDTFVHNPSMLNDSRLVFRYEGHYFAAIRSSPLFTSLLIFKRPLEEKEVSSKVSDSRDTYSYGRGWRQWLSRSSSADAVPNIDKPELTTHDEKKDEGERTTFTTTTKTTSVGWSPEHNHNDDDTNIFTKRKMYAKTLRLTSDQLKNLNLKKGVNTISFSVKSAYQGTATCVAKVFFWDYDIQVVISDIDGTITKSDAMGHLMTMMGKDWTHDGVAQLYTDISNNRYHFMYLTSRAIGQADYTRDYLKKVLQGNYQLPDGPVIMSPDRLFISLHREVIMRKPEMFKMACLRDIQRLFGGRDPFYAGFGNRITDAISYRSVNVPSSRIFTIDAQGDVKLELLTGFKSSYIHLNDLVDQIFPPIDKTIHEEYNDFNYWKAPMPEIDIPELEEEGPMPTSPKPKPIKPDPQSLPKESVVAYTPEPKRGLLRSFTSRSSKSATTTPPKSSISRSSTSTSTSTSSTKTVLPSSPPTLSSSASAPVLTATAELDEKNKSEASSVMSSPVSLPADYKHSDDDESSTPTPPPSQPRARSSSGIMRKVMGGVFSRKVVTPPPVSSEEDSKRKDSEDYYKHDDDIDEEEEDELFNTEIDDLDLDKIPFI